uniref:protein-serine/threonine phosphatase n=1 Tax=Rhizochromulina marina TaxID=1034831 RepID=A0A7S2RZ40_9STRA
MASGVAGVAPSSAMPLPPRPAPALGAAAGVVQAPRTPPQRPQPSTTSVCTPLSSSGVRQGTPRKALAPEIAELVVQAAADTADAVVAKNQWKRVNDLFLSLRTKSDKFDKAKLRARLAADPSLITTRVSTRLDGRHRDGFTLLHTAAECGHTAAIETILEFDEAPRAIWSVDLQGRTPLHIAAEAGKLRACRLLKEAMIQNGQSPVGASAPVDLSGLTPAAWNARAESALRSKPRVNQEELTDRSALKELLFAPGDPGVLPATPFQTRSGGAVQVFGISDAPGWRVSMEDAHCAYSPLPGHADTGLCLFAIFDGHGGAFSARFAASQIGRRIAEHPATKSFPLDPGALSQALVDVILALDQDLAAQPVMQPTPKYRAEDASGATVLVALTTPTHLLVANCGDSHGVLLRADGQGFVPIAVASPHSPQLEAEAKRIHMAGHRVENGRVDGNLAVSRAIGDFQFKTPGVAPENQAVSPVPEVKIIPRTMKDEMLFMACDGIWDVMTEDDIAAFAMRARPEAGYQAPSELTQFCDSIIMEACVERCSGDNVSAIAVSMLHTSSQSSSQLARRIDFGEESEDAAT